MHAFKASGKWKVRIALWALTLYPIFKRGVPLGGMEPDARLAFLKKYFMADTPIPRHRFLRRGLQTAIGAAAQLVYLCYYGDERTFDSIKYTPFSRRPTAPPEEDREPKKRLPLKVDVPGDIPDDIPSRTIKAEVVIVGSGAAGAVLAYEMAAEARASW